MMKTPNMGIVYVAPVQNKAGIHFMLNLSDQKVIIIQIVISNNSFFETYCLIN